MDGEKEKKNLVFENPPWLVTRWSASEIGIRSLGGYFGYREHPGTDMRGISLLPTISSTLL